jgi:Zn-dependent protease
VEKVIEGICWYVAFLFSVTAHEAAHAWLAKLGGDLTAYHGGQVSLDPIPHIKREPFGTVVFPLISLFALGWPFGYASAPYDPEWAQRHTKRAALMALAGPASNLILVMLSALFIRIGVSMGCFVAPHSILMTHVTVSSQGGIWAGVALFISMLFSLNLILAVLNVIPFPPLDGSGAIVLFMSDETARRYRQFVSYPAFGWIGLLLAWKVFNPLFSPIFLIAINLLYPGSHYG